MNRWRDDHNIDMRADGQEEKCKYGQMDRQKDKNKDRSKYKLTDRHRGLQKGGQIDWHAYYV